MRVLKVTTLRAGKRHHRHAGLDLGQRDHPSVPSLCLLASAALLSGLAGAPGRPGRGAPKTERPRRGKRGAKNEGPGRVAPCLCCRGASAGQRPLSAPANPASFAGPSGNKTADSRKWPNQGPCSLPLPLVVSSREQPCDTRLLSRVFKVEDMSCSSLTGDTKRKYGKHGMVEANEAALGVKGETKLLLVSTARKHSQAGCLASATPTPDDSATFNTRKHRQALSWRHAASCPLESSLMSWRHASA
jgi:hypothetical protein